ncbi:uncharacterized protein BP5553_10509 [Venustampulla echinocandica]|uniref:Uncharacterized protein n=1 Tax=Venustampulla echinocandica TaxID=2656787 RepID=A0A370T9H9_9HELO|nr:uncharacterized protein BP5553_10509 [Venustampulla echinocandica]RDL30231.1 hypothetical protein BP5553_10509 [Venustampulla echinocandica]
MCVTNVYVDRYPDGHAVTFRQTSTCQYGSPGRPCPTLSVVENPVRKITWGEPSTEHMLTRSFPLPAQRPLTPPRSPSSHRRQSSSESSGHRRKHSKRVLSPLRPTRQHRKERIVIVDSPPTPRTPPQLYNQTFTAPPSPVSQPFHHEHRHHHQHPIIVDERPLRRTPSNGAVVSERPAQSRRPRSQTRQNPMWDSPSSSHTSFNSRLRYEEEELERQRELQRELERERIERAASERQRERLLREREERLQREKELEAKLRKEALIKAQDEEIRRRPAVPLAPIPALRRQQRPLVVAQDLPTMMGALAIEDEEGDKEAMKRRLRERQLPKRRFSVGPGYRRHRVAYDDGMYRWE